MWLINCESKELEWFVSEDEAPPYAILSHTWADDEITFTDMSKPSVQKREAFIKIALSCQQATEDGLQYVWIDTYSAGTPPLLTAC